MTSRRPVEIVRRSFFSRPRRSLRPLREFVRDRRCKPLHAAALAVALTSVILAAQQPAAPPPIVWVTVTPIEPPATPLPAEAASASITRYSFLAYGDTRTGATPSDADAPNPEHTAVMDGMLAKIKEL